jgi:hypothetical protein
MSNIIDITGQRFGRLTVVACAGRTKRGNTIWTCRCDCGNEKIVQASHLRSGSTTSCGCLRQEGYVNRGRKKIGVLIFPAPFHEPLELLAHPACRSARFITFLRHRIFPRDQGWRSDREVRSQAGGRSREDRITGKSKAKVRIKLMTAEGLPAQSFKTAPPALKVRIALF